jgi:cyclophilin family peptidyl-prolyl cis-trans isomerase
MKWKQWAACVLLFSVCLMAAACGQAPQKAAAPRADHYAVIHTNMGNITLQLYDSKAPVTTENFEKLANDGFYVGTIFHRVIPGFMIQGGDPQGNGTGGPGYKIKDEFAEGLNFDQPGVLAMANSGPNTGGSQFFITVAPTPWLKGKHAIFGQVIDGADVVVKISQAERDSQDKPLQEIQVQKVDILTDRP